MSQFYSPFSKKFNQFSLPYLAFTSHNDWFNCFSVLHTAQHYDLYFQISFTMATYLTNIYWLQVCSFWSK